MQSFLDSYPAIVAYIGVIDAVFVLILGTIAASLWLFDIKADKFWERVFPASWILVGTSVAAGIIIGITRYVAGHIAAVAVVGAALALFYVNPASAAVVDFGGVFGSASQYLSAAVDAAITAGCGWLFYTIQRKFKVDVEAQYRQTLEAWLKRQAASLLADGAAWVTQHGKIEVKSEMLASASNLLFSHIPDAAKFFGLTPQLVQSKIVDMIPQVPNAPALLAANIATPPVPTAILSGATPPPQVAQSAMGGA